MKVQLSDHFTYRRLLRFTLPSVIMMVFTSIYSVVDGFFVSNFAGKIPFAAVNLIFPFTGLLSCLGFMFGAGGAALVSKTLGEGDREKANRIFSMLVYVSIATGAVLGILGIIFVEPIAVWMGAEGEILENCVIYGRILLLVLPAFMLQNVFQSFLVAAEKPGIGLSVTVAAGLMNIVLDAVLVAGLGGGVIGAAVATAISQLVGGVVPLVYFSKKNGSLLKLGKCSFELGALFQSCTNGASELVTNASLSVTSMLFNFQLMRLVGEDGVAAYGAVMYVSFFFVAMFLGYAIGVSPVIGFHYGAENHRELKNLFRKSNLLILGTSVTLALAAMLLASPLASFFVGYDKVLFDMTVRAFRFYSVSILFSGFCIFGSAFFTSLNNGLISAFLSFLRLFFLQVLSVLILPEFFELDGVWLSLILPDMIGVLVTFAFFITQRKRYHY